MEILIEDLASPVFFAALEILDRQPTATVLKIKASWEADRAEELIILKDYRCVTLTIDEENISGNCLLTFTRLEENASAELILETMASWDEEYEAVEIYGALSEASQEEVRKILL